MGIEFRDLDKKSINDSDTDYSDESREIDDFG